MMEKKYFKDDYYFAIKYFCNFVHKRVHMKIITSREFREKQKAYFDLSEKERIIVHRGKNRKPVLISTIEESEESDIYFSDPKVMASIREGIEDIKAGRVTKIRDPNNIWQDIL